MPERPTHDYVRHGNTSLFAALNVKDGTVISSVHRTHRSVEFKKFLTKIDKNVPRHLDVHVVCDNYSTHKHPTVKAWLEKHPRFPHWPTIGNDHPRLSGLGSPVRQRARAQLDTPMRLPDDHSAARSAFGCRSVAPADEPLAGQAKRVRRVSTWL